MRKSKNSCLLAGFFLLILFIHFCDVAYAGGGSLLASLRQDRELLDRITKTSVSLNKVSLLHLGKRSVPVRLSLIQQAKKFLFVSVPYWFADQSGEMMYSAIASQKRRNPSLDVRVFEDWSSPGSTGDPFALNMFFRIERLTEGNAFLWNSPYWGRNFSLKLIQNRLHEKLLIVDGQKMVMGGMNIGDSYLRGGLDRKGWHDTDLVIEGPSAAAAGRVFVKLWEFSRYFSDPTNFFPRDAESRRRALSEYFFHDKEVFHYVRNRSLLSPGRREVIRIPFSGQMKVLGIDQARDISEAEGGVPVRILYDNPLFNQEVKKGAATYCKFSCVLNFLMDRTRESARFFSPYLTITSNQEDLLVAAARRGVKVELITNSFYSHDMGAVAYFASVAHYIRLLENGVRIYEWQGNKFLEGIEEREDCQISERDFPGRTIHTKGVVLDGEVAILGSNNMNLRSEKYNSEVMAIVEDPVLAGELNKVFEYDLDQDPSRKILCGNRLIKRPRRVREIHLEEARNFVRKNRFLIELARVFEKFI